MDLSTSKILSHASKVKALRRELASHKKKLQEAKEEVYLSDLGVGLYPGGKLINISKKTLDESFEKIQIIIKELKKLTEPKKK